MYIWLWFEKRTDELIKFFTQNQSKQGKQDQPELVMKALADSFEQLTFTPWFARYKDVFAEDANSLGDKGKVRLVMRKLDTASYDRFINHIAPKLVGELTFSEAVASLKAYFDEKESALSRRFNCLQKERRADEDIRDYGSRVNKLGEDFQLDKLNKDEFKCLLYILGLKRTTDPELRTRLLTMYQKEKDTNLTKIQAEAAAVTAAKKDASLGIVDAPPVLAIHQPKTSQSHSRQYREQEQLPPSPCWKCGGIYFVSKCPFQDHKCTTCRKVWLQRRLLCIC